MQNEIEAKTQTTQSFLEFPEDPRFLKIAVLIGMRLSMPDPGMLKARKAIVDAMFQDDPSLVKIAEAINTWYGD